MHKPSHKTFAEIMVHVSWLILRRVPTAQPFHSPASTERHFQALNFDVRCREISYEGEGK